MSNNPFKKFQSFRQSNAVTGKTRTVLIVVMLIVSIAIGVLAAIIGRKYGDENCNCISVNDAGFRGWSIAMLVVGIPLLVVGFIFFGCTTEVAEASWNPQTWCKMQFDKNDLKNKSV